MIDIKLLRANPDLFKSEMSKRFMDDQAVIVDDVLSLDSSWRSVKKQIDDLRKSRNELSRKVNEAKKSGDNALFEKLLSEVKDIPSKISALESEASDLEGRLFSLLNKIPNVLHESVPLGRDDSENVEIARFGPEPVVKKVKPHQIVVEELGLADFTSSAKTSGNGFYYLEGELALLNQALIRYGIEIMHKHGFRYVETPLMLRGEVIEKVVDLADQENQIYKIENEDLYLIGTSEHSMIGRFIGKLLKKDQLPIKQTSYSMCFRKEKGSHGLDEKGLFRTHQFNKVEMIVICDPKDSMSFFEKLKNITLEIFVGLGLPVRVLQICSGDLGLMKHLQVDIEAWSPRKNGYIEVGSCSNLTDNQARSLGIRVSDGVEKFVPHTLNNTAIATSRALVAILENFQNEDGSVDIPSVLHPYMMGITRLTPSN